MDSEVILSAPSESVADDSRYQKFQAEIKLNTENLIGHYNSLSFLFRRFMLQDQLARQSWQQDEI